MKMNRKHAIPLTKQTLALLEFIKPISGHREFLFPADRNAKKHANESTANVAISRMGFKGRLVAHGLRSIASTTLHEQMFDTNIIECCLSHGDENKVRAAYKRTTFLELRQEIMDWWSNHIYEASKGNLSISENKSIRSI